jgi:DNA replication protein DnaC
MKSIKEYTPSHRYFQRLQALPKGSLSETEKNYTEEQVEFRKQYVERMKAQPQANTVDEIEKEHLRHLFLDEFRNLNGKEYIKTPDSIQNLELILDYFTRDDNFFKSNRLSSLSTPSFEKGLLVVGDFGCGKSSMMEVFSNVLCRIRFTNSFVFKTMNDVVSDFESLREHQEKNEFWMRINVVRYLFDDVKTEREASNYGKSNLFKEIAEKRSYNGIVTHVTCNYDPSRPGDLKQAIAEFGSKYGGRVYDRIFEMFNIIEFKGKSFRK